MTCFVSFRTCDSPFFHAPPLYLVEADNETLLPVREYLAIAIDCSCKVTDLSVFAVQSLRQNHLSETYSWPTCGYHFVCGCPTEWCNDVDKDIFFDRLGAMNARIPGSEFLIP